MNKIKKCLVLLAVSLKCLRIHYNKEYDEIWLRNEGLPTGEGLFQLYIWFCKERGFIVDKVIEDLNVGVLIISTAGIWRIS